MAATVVISACLVMSSASMVCNGTAFLHLLCFLSRSRGSQKSSFEPFHHHRTWTDNNLNWFRCATVVLNFSQHEVKGQGHIYCEEGGGIHIVLSAIQCLWYVNLYADSVGDWSSEVCRGFHRRRLQLAGEVYDVFCNWKNWEEDQITETWQSQVQNGWLWAGRFCTLS